MSSSSPFTQTVDKKYKLFTEMYNDYDFSNFYFDDIHDTFIAKFIGHNELAIKITSDYTHFLKNYEVHKSLNETVINLQNMKVNDSDKISGDQLNAFINKMQLYINTINKKF